jgi:hypothetical protein
MELLADPALADRLGATGRAYATQHLARDAVLQGLVDRMAQPQWRERPANG